MVENYCVSCHNETRRDGGVSLASYAQVSAVVETGAFLGTITNTNGFPLMPQGASIPDCEIKQVEKWIASGALNN